MGTGIERQRSAAGFWIRLLAAVLDFVFLFILLVPVRVVLNHRGIYVPLELTMIVLYLFGSALLTWRCAGSVGKRSLGLVVQSTQGDRIRLPRALVREVVGKTLSAICFLLGFVKIGVSKEKRGYHDIVAHTKVIHRVCGPRSNRLRALAVLVVIVGMAGIVSPTLWRAHRYSNITVPQTNTSPLGAQVAPNFSDVDNLDDSDYERMFLWLQEHGKSPEDYAIETVMNHRVTIFGEVHGKKEYLDFLVKILPSLYHKAGVTCIAMECCRSQDNDALRRLVTAKTFDQALALAIARRSVWQSWGYTEYWDVLRTVWQINRSLPVGRKPLRVVGINFSWDGPSIALVQAGPIWEKLRIVRAWDDFLLNLVAADGLYAGSVEEEIIKKNERGIVWVGAAHSPLTVREVFLRRKGRIVMEASRMGSLLHQEYGNTIAQIVLHSNYKSPKIANVIQQIIESRNVSPVGFDVSGSPFHFLRDESSRYYQAHPEACFSGFAQGYIYIKPLEELSRCSWQDGFISRTMFGRNRPFYEVLCQRTLRDSAEANTYLAATGGILQ